jgi:ankyrin repeat protein
LEYSHKRSRSALSLSILHREKSKSEDNAEEGLNFQDGANFSVAASSTANGSTPRPSLALRSNSRHKGGSFTTASPSASNDGNLTSTSSNDPQDGSRKAGNAGAVKTGGDLSIEQSVRTFRLFETLRSGDTNAISKALKESQDHQQESGGAALGTTILHLAIQCADPQVVEYVMSNSTPPDINARDRDGNTPLHLAAQLGRDSIVRQLLEQPNIDDSIANYRGQTALDLARTPEIFQQLQLAKSLFIDSKTKELQELINHGDYEKLEKLLEEPRVEGTFDVNSPELVTEPATWQSGGTLLHEGARKRDTRLIQVLLLHGADPFRRDKKGRLPQDVTKDDKTRAIVKRSPAAVIAQRGIQERAILGNAASQASLGRAGNMESTIAGKEARELRGYLKKWTNYTSGFKLRWFVLEDGVLSYYKHQGKFTLTTIDPAQVLMVGNLSSNRRCGFGLSRGY